MAHVTFIHGISNKPPEEKLLQLWLQSLSTNMNGRSDAIDLGTEGVSSSMVYWADVLYENPVTENTIEEESLSGIRGYESLDVTLAGHEESDPSMAWREHLEGDEKEMVDTLSQRLSFDVLKDDTSTAVATAIDTTLERIPLPWFIKRRIMKQFLRDVHHYLFAYEFSPRKDVTYQVQKEIRGRAIKRLLEGSKKTGPHIVVAHSMGTIIAYDCLMNMNECPPIDGLITIGSPLGIDEVQDKLTGWTRENGFPAKLNGPWINIYDTLDPVTGFDGNISNDFKKNGEELIEVINEPNWGAWRHNITKYFAGEKLRAALCRTIGI